MRSLRAIAATLVFIEFGAAAHRLGVGVPVQAIPKVVVAVLVAPTVWLLLRSSVSLPRALLAASSAQVIVHLALLGMEPSSGGSAAPTHLHESFRVVPIDGTGPVAGPPPSVPLIQAHVASVLLTCLILLVADDVLRAVMRGGDAAASSSTAEMDARSDRQPRASARPRHMRHSETPFVVQRSPGGFGVSVHSAAATKPPHARRPPLPR